MKRVVNRVAAEDRRRNAGREEKMYMQTVQLAGGVAETLRFLGEPGFPFRVQEVMTHRGR